MRRRSKQTDSGKATGAAPSQSRPAAWADGRAVFGICLFLAAIIWVVFGQTARFGFVNVDDNLYVYENAKVTGGLSLQGCVWAFTHLACNFYHPLTMISLMADYQFHQLHAGGYHLTNVLIHTASAILLFLVLWRMTGALWRSALVAAVFAVHPLRAESVAWVTERKDVLGALFFMLTLWAYASYVGKQKAESRKQKYYYGLVLVFFVLGLLCKPTAVTLPFVLLLLDYWPLGRLEKQKVESRKQKLDGRKQELSGVSFWGLVREKIPLLALALAASAGTYFAQGESVVPIAKIPAFVRIGNVLISYVAHLRQMVWPSGLALYYPYPEKGSLMWESVLAFLLLAVISGLVLALRRKRPWLVTGWFWYLGMLVPVIGFVAVNPSARGDRNTYLPQIGFCVLGIWAAAGLSARWRHRRALQGALAAGLLVVLICLARAQTAYWHDSESLWRRALARAPGASLVEEGLATALVEKGEMGEAIALYRKALETSPKNERTRYNFGIALAKSGQTEEAIVEYRKILEINPTYENAHNNLGIALARNGQTAEAIAEYLKVLELNPAHADARLNLGIELAKNGQLEEAVTQYKKVLETNPGSAVARCNLGDALLRQGHTGEAVACFQKALESQPDYAKAHYDLANVLFDQGRTDAAIAHYQGALATDPGFVEAQFNLGNALLQTGRWEEAVAHYNKVLELHPGHSGALNNLGTAYRQLGRAPEAMGAYREALKLQPENVDVLNNLAWLLATGSDAALRDGAAALDMAQHATRLAGGGNPLTLRTLAAAYAETGSFGMAAGTARRALELAAEQKNDAMAATLQEEIKLYETDRPVRESMAPGSERVRPKEAP